MKTPTIYFQNLTDEMLNTLSRIRVENKTMCYTIEIKRISKNKYVYLYKKHEKKLYKIYVGSLEDVIKSKEIIIKKAQELDYKITQSVYPVRQRLPSYENNDRSYWINPTNE